MPAAPQIADPLVVIMGCAGKRIQVPGLEDLRAIRYS